MITHVRPQLGWPIVNSSHGESDVTANSTGRLAGKAAQCYSRRRIARLLDSARPPTF